MQSPQFPAQDGMGSGTGMAPIAQWQQVATTAQDCLQSPLGFIHIDPTIHDIFSRLRTMLHNPEDYNLSSTDFHDLVCYILHRLLWETSHLAIKESEDSLSISESIRYALVLYLLTLHGPTYFSHAQLQYITTLKLKFHLEQSLAWLLPSFGSLTLWLLSVGMIASEGSIENEWFVAQAAEAAAGLEVSTWEELIPQLEELLWSKTPQMEFLFKERWMAIWQATPD